MKKTPDNPILTLVKNAQPVNAKGEPDQWVDRRTGDFMIRDGRVWFMREGRDRSKKAGDDQAPQCNEIPTELTVNFIAIVTEQIILDDGAKQETAFRIVGKQRHGGLLPELTIPATQYQAMQWPLKHWGARAIVEANQATPRRLANAILMLSGDIPITTIYQHTGWRQINGEWLYLTGNGAIGADGFKPEIRVELDGGNMQRYELPEPTDNPRSIAGALFGLLDIAPENKAVGTALFCCIVRAVLGECEEIDFSLFLFGLTGSQKSELAALALACFGRFDRKHLTANWSDSESDKEHKSHQSKDGVFIIDDFVPSVNITEANRLHSKAERLFRAVGNQAGRGRRNTDMSGKAAYHPRGMVIATGEDLPKGPSLLGRLLIIELKRGDVTLSFLSDFQSRAKSGELAATMSTFIKWLAPQMAELKRTFPDRVRNIRDNAVTERFAQSHPRAPDIYASLFAAADIYIQFAEAVGAIGPNRANELMQSIDETLKTAVMSQVQFQKSSDEVERFINLLRAAFGAGECHVGDHLNQGPPELLPFVWGWRSDNPGADLGGCGQLIGWINQPQAELWLEPEAVFKVIQRFASSQNEPILMQKSTLFKRLLERGLLADFETDKQSGGKRPDVKRSVAGKRCRVLVFHSNVITEGGEN